jgi:hypothetical protein
MPDPSSIDWIWPRREFRSPMTSPMYSSGVRTSTAMSGSRMRVRLADGLLEAHGPAILNAISDESTSCDAPSSRIALTPTIG